MAFVWYIIIGALAGYLASLLVKGEGLGCLGNILLGVIGGVIGGWLLREMNWGPWGHFGTSFLGACLLLLVVNLLNRR
ncbi:putative membrane protein YeaQ/YmgE (transglycosylase-associated protein family) [Chitinophaga skermanii]|uniref:Putative membrane protein YeaQ/YmgE (Transglycosylase-associated protein family) n=1 Tax=Chitinophaga skermanii TaxID=331697 RepID=A0A327QCP1_9BACT|nr:GlsB/YeaQ/YmgE family stress response membrane protein [Chitinophaga skermanii]RAJ01604.1 putative membrane protein YeaQ/YmgE (transglycosylase-associated protein family) [Chitinophaga skermanii]